MPNIDAIRARWNRHREEVDYVYDGRQQDIFCLFTALDAANKRIAELEAAGKELARRLPTCEVMQDDELQRLIRLLGVDPFTLDDIDEEAKSDA